MPPYRGPLDSLRGFPNPRKYPKLPEGYVWKNDDHYVWIEIEGERKYSVEDDRIWSQSWKISPNPLISSTPSRQPRRTQLEKYATSLNLHELLMVPDDDHISLCNFYRTGITVLDGAKREENEMNFNRLSHVFCHRGLYDNASRIPENSKSAIENGVHQGLLLHELDVVVSPESLQSVLAHLAHDDSAGRVTSKNLMFKDMTHEVIIQLSLVCRPWDTKENNWARCYIETEDKVLDLNEAIRLLEMSRSMAKQNTFQFDVKGMDFAKILAWFRFSDFGPAKIFKGYNTYFSSGRILKEAVESSSYARDTWPDWKTDVYGLNPDLFETSSRNSSQAIIMVIFWQPIVKLAKAAIEDEKQALTYEHLYYIARTHICSFVDTRIFGYSRIIPEIVTSGLGLGYDVKSEVARDPMDGSLIIDPEVILESRVDRAMMEVSLRLRLLYPQLPSVSCTRLYDAMSPEGKIWSAHPVTGKAVPRNKGDKGISANLRCVPGGLYPQSDIVVAEDPFLEIAARTWIDEYAELDRSRLLEIPYWEWIEEGDRKKPGLLEAINELHGPFLPNTFAKWPLTDRGNLQITDA